MTVAPTTLSAIAPSITPVRSRTIRYTVASRFWNSRMTITAGPNAHSTTSVSCHEYTNMTRVDTMSWPDESSRSTPPVCRNWEIWSTSLVTRDTIEPRRSACWCSIDRSCTCRKVRARSAARAVSLTVNSRLVIR
jgi:hypothetical protein